MNDKSVLFCFKFCIKKYQTKSILVVFLLSWSLLAFTQPDTIKRNWIHLGYNGENITRYGLSTGYGYSFYQKHKHRIRKEKVSLHQLYVEANLSLSVHPNNQFLLSCLPDIGYRFTTHTNWHLQLSVGIGIVRTFYNAKSFQPDENGYFTEIKLAGKWSLGTTISAGFGKAVDKKKTLLVNTQFRLLNEHFYNKKILMHPIFQIGIIKKI